MCFFTKIMSAFFKQKLIFFALRAVSNVGRHETRLLKLLMFSGKSLEIFLTLDLVAA